MINSEMMVGIVFQLTDGIIHGKIAWWMFIKILKILLVDFKQIQMYRKKARILLYVIQIKSTYYYTQIKCHFIIKTCV